MTSGALKEKAFLAKFGRPLHPIQRIRREHVDYQRQHPSEHMAHLDKYLQAVKHLVPQDATLSRPTLRHPDLQPNNVFISDNMEITGLIDWQHGAILPLFLQAGIPGSLQNYGDDISEMIVFPQLPEDFDGLSEDDQLKHVLVLRKRQLHYHYVVETRKMNPTHARTLEDDADILRRKLFRRSGEPWEGCNTIFKRDLVELVQRWHELQSTSNNPLPDNCPIQFDAEDTNKTISLASDMESSDQQWKTCLELVGAGPEGWVPTHQYEDAKQRAEQLKADTLTEAETEEERQEILENWIFDDFDETEYL